MKQQRIHEIVSEIRQKHPLIHCITNPISINQCANAILAVGGRPIMAEHPKEVAEITVTAQALMLNLGNITDTRMESVRISAVAAAEASIPFLLDVVGIACSSLRREYVHDLLSEVSPTVIKGNYSEINALLRDCYHASGVDADAALDVQTIDRVAIALAKEKNTIILASGKIDIITDGKRLVHIYNGIPQLAAITGTGCMQGALCAAYLSTGKGLDAVIAACAVLGICGQLSETNTGNGSFATNLLDALSTFTDAEIKNHLNLEEFQF